MVIFPIYLYFFVLLDPSSSVTGGHGVIIPVKALLYVLRLLIFYVSPWFHYYCKYEQNICWEKHYPTFFSTGIYTFPLNLKAFDKYVQVVESMSICKSCKCGFCFYFGFFSELDFNGAIFFYVAILLCSLVLERKWILNTSYTSKCKILV